MIILEKTEEQIASEILVEIPDTYQKSVGFFAWDFCLATAKGAVSNIYTALKYLCSLGKFANWEFDDLNKLFSNLRNINAKTAGFSSGKLKIATGSGTINKGALFETESGMQFEATETKTVNVGDTFEVKCLTPGTEGNVPAGAITIMPSTIQGIAAVTNETAFINGYNAETKEELINRFLIDVKKPVTSGNKYHYEKWALECNGVAKCKVKPLWNGDNTVKVVIINQNFEVADVELVKNVQNYIDPYELTNNIKVGWGCGNGQAPLGAYCTVESATAKNITVSASLTLKSGEVLNDVKQDIETQIKAYFKEISFKGEYVSFAKIGSAILNADGVADYSDLLINEGIDNILLVDNNTTSEIPVLNNLTITERVE